MINKSILSLLGKAPVSWYTESKYWPLIVILVNTWKSVGYGCLIYIAGIAGIDKSFYEAAEIDGAGKLVQIWKITLPSLVPAIITLTLLSIGRMFYSDFGLFYQVPMDSGSLYNATNVIDTYVYRALLKIGNIGMSSAAGVYQSVVGLIMVLLSNWIVRKRSNENALF
jgi:putative aldouronate transport system permease protein